LIHRYDFENVGGTTVTDRVGAAHGTTVGTVQSAIDDKGVVVLAGGSSNQYVDLPNSLISNLTDVTIESWVTWSGGNLWQRIFEFGHTSGAEGTQGQGGLTYLYLTPRAGTGPRLAFSLNEAQVEDRVDGSSAFPINTLTQVVAVADSTGSQLALYVNGALAGSTPWVESLASINDVNVWLGRSQAAADPDFGGTFHELRIYSAALTAEEIATAYLAGPDPSFLAR
jgi:hypothetical protein